VLRPAGQLLSAGHGGGKPGLSAARRLDDHQERAGPQLVLAQIIEPVSKLDSARVLEEAGVAAASYRNVRRRLPVYATEPRRQRLSAAHAGLGKRAWSSMRCPRCERRAR
jgi:hypothetical protein